MAQRHPALIPLASDHYAGLSLALRLQQSGKTPSPLWSDDHRFQAGYVVSFFEKELRHHFEVEETVLFPLAQEFVPEARALVGNLLSDHRAMESSVKQLCRVEESDLAHKLKEFGLLLEEHIRREDRELFPMFETKASPEVLAWALSEILSRYPALAVR